MNDDGAVLGELRRAVAEAPGDAARRLALAERLDALGLAEAERHYRLAYALASSALPPPVAGPAEWADAQIEAALELLRGDQPAAARQALDKALRLRPRCLEPALARLEAEAPLLVRLAEVLAAAGQPAAAVAAYRGALDRSFFLPGVPAALGALLAGMGQAGEAVELLALAAAEAPADATRALAVAELWARLGHPAEAVPWYRRAAAAGASVAGPLAEALGRCREEGRFRMAEGEDQPGLLLDTLRRLPLPGGGAVVVESLPGGYQNAVRRIRCGDAAYALRLGKFPSARWDFYCEERANLQVAAAAGLAPAVAYFDTADGTLLTGFVEGPALDYRTMLAPARLDAAAALYRRLHGLPRFRGDYDIFAMTDGLAGRRPDVSDPALADLPELARALAEIRTVLTAGGVPAAPCHNDPVPQNFIDTGGALVLVDWQCSGQSDPHWELGAFCAQLALSPAQERAFLGAYFGDADHPGARRARLYKLVCHGYWLRSHLAKAADPAAGDWRSLALDAAAALRRLLAEPGYPALLAAARDGVRERLK